MHCFGHGLLRSYVKYCIAAVVYHLGPTLQSGHYKAALSPEAFLYGCKRPVWHIGDDGKHIQTATQSDISEIQMNCHVIGLMLVDEAPGA